MSSIGTRGSLRGAARRAFVDAPARGRSCAGRCSPPTYRMTRSAPTASAASSAPSSTRCGAQRHERAVLGAERLALGSVGKDDRASLAAIRDGRPTCAPQGSPRHHARAGRSHRGSGSGRRPTGAARAAVDGRRGSRGRRSGGGPARIAQRRHRPLLGVRPSGLAGRDDRPATSPSELRIDPPTVRRQMREAPTARQHAPVIASIHGAKASLPAVRLWRTAIGHAAHASQWTARQSRWPIRSRTRLVMMTATSRSTEITPRATATGR